MSQQKTALILGATGGIGGEAARTLKARGWRIRALHRKGGAASSDGFDWIRGDAMVEADVIAAAAARGHRARRQSARLPRLERPRPPDAGATIAAARASGARIVFPGNVYNYAPGAGPIRRGRAADADHPQRPIRVEMESR